MANEVEIIVTDKYKSGGGFDKAEKEAKSSGSKMADIGKKAGAAAGVATAGALAVGLSNAMNIESAQAKLTAQLGGTSEMSKAAGQVAGDLYAGAYGDSLEAVGDAVKTVIQSGALMEDASNDQIKSITGQAMSLAQAFDVDVTESMRAVGQMVRTNMAPDAEAGLDLIARAFQQLGPQAADVLDTFNEYGVQFQKIGIDGQEALGMIQQMVKAGARDTDLAADALKEFAIRAVDGSKGAAESFKALGFNADEMIAKFAKGGPTAEAAFGQVIEKLKATKGQADASTIAFGLFGTQSEDLQNALYAIDPSTAVAGLGEVAGASKELDAVLNDTAAVRLTAMKRRFEEWTASMVMLPAGLGTAAAALVTFGGTALEMVTPIAGIITAHYAHATAATISGTSTAAASTVVKVSWISSAATAMASAITIAAAWLISIAPIALVIAGIMAVIAVIVLIVKNWDMLGRVVERVMGWIRLKVMESVNFIVGKFHFFVGFFQGVAARISSLGSSMWNGLVSGTRMAVNVVINALNGIIMAINGLISAYNSIPIMPDIGKVPHIPRASFASGGVSGGGTALVGEHGPELVRLAAGSSVIPNGATRSRMGGGMGQTVVILRIESAGGSVNDMLVELLRKAVKNQGGNVQTVLGR